MYTILFRIMTEKCKPFVSLSEVKCKPYHKWVDKYCVVTFDDIENGLMKLY